MAFPEPQGFDKELVFQFFWRFAAFECALKQRGFLQQKDRDRGRADVDWKDFAKKIEGKFSSVSLAGFDQAVEKLKGLSLRKQVTKNRSLDWEMVTREKGRSEEQYVLDLLNVVRNNLFHGGKLMYARVGSSSAIARDCGILCAALKVLEGCYELHDGVRREIDSIAAA